MVTYIYFVKCPNCEDEHFDFFDEAKEFALSCLSKKPIITQTEVCRNDFGECTDHSDLGTVWSWEDMMKDTEEDSAQLTFSKDDLKTDYNPDNDPEFQDDDFFAVNNEEESTDTLTEAKRDPFHEAIFEAIDYLTEFEHIFPVPENIGAHTWGELKDDINYGLSSDFEIAEIIMEYLDKDLAIGKKHPEIFEDDPQSELTLETYNRLKRAYDRAVADYKATHAEDFEESCGRKPIPEDMTIEQLVETMEENEDTVECAGCEELFPKDECSHKEGIGYLCGDCEDRVVKCTWCDELYDRSECRKEVDLGWLCDRCQAGIMSRGEPLTFRENDYWDFLDEKLDIDFSNCVSASDHEIWGVTHEKDNMYKAVLLKRYENVSFSDCDECDRIHEEMYDIDGLFLFTFGKDGKPTVNSWNVDLLRRLGPIDVGFDDIRYEDALAKVFNKSASGLEEATEEFINDPPTNLDEGYQELLNKKVEIYYPELKYTFVTNMDRITDVLVDIVTDEDVQDLTAGKYETVDEICSIKPDMWTPFLESYCEVLYDLHEEEVNKALYEDAVEAMESGESSEDEGPGGGAFASWDDFNHWKNGDLR